MDRREFLKNCSLALAGFSLFGCTKTETKKIPSDEDFEREVQMALSLKRENIPLVKIEMPSGKLNQKVRLGMAIDLTRCDTCGACILACNKENNIPLVPKEDAELGHFMHWIQLTKEFPLMCFHCEDAPCEKVCPTLAASHSLDGVSVMMYKRCAGSRFCGANCPVHARKFNAYDNQKENLSRVFNANVPLREKGVMEKCSFCLQRIQENRIAFKTENPTREWIAENFKTACANACPKHAIYCGNWLDENSELVKEAKRHVLYAPESIAAFNPSIVYMRELR